MRKGVFLAVLVLLIAAIPSGRASAEPVSFSQVITPLQCTIDIVHDGPVTNVKLSPKECMRSPEARELLKEAKRHYHQH